MSCNASMLNQHSTNQGGGACGACQSTLFGGKKKAPKSSARRSYRRRVSKSKCKGKRASTCRNSKTCKMAFGKKRSYCRKRSNKKRGTVRKKSRSSKKKTQKMKSKMVKLYKRLSRKKK